MNRSTTEFRVQGRHVLFAVVGFFALVIGVDATFMALAIRSFPGQVSETPFEDGLAYNRTLARRAAQARLGYTAQARATGDGVEVRLRARDGAPLTVGVLSAMLRRPATEAGQRELRFAETSPGVYSAPAADLSGVWDLSLSARDRAGRAFEAEQRLTWPR